MLSIGGNRWSPEPIRSTGPGRFGVPMPNECYYQDAVPSAGLILDRHVVLGRRPPPGGEATALCGRVLVIGPGPFEAEPGVPALGHRNCWDCQDVILGVTPEPPERQAEPVRLVRTAPRAGSVVGATRRVVHVCSADTPVDAPLLTRCGTRLSEAEVETVAPGVGMPCSACLLAGDPPPQAYPLPDIGRAAS
ncbi:hypothetical protein [Actinoalloteichus hymeniacidonis]|uniref:Uncharacterized protein n=1 Tax=Actinoalloteichus hymeniacidonis TaxID=340345 RepID=A0AAC9HSI6_9PSEU|nr:hypothetical protein [Actinoalloteichus hymeniacidonis]AOS64822.1 hypothetical protein TL08_20155 [Actinoalloteichus hymeniacidonis]MBB5907103.1 hypothetical protein [Actinoalloteichus hymeniacidonis]